MFSKTETKSDLVPLTELVADGFAESVGELVDLLSERGAAFSVDSSGRLAVTVEFAAELRSERDEKQAQEAAERAEAERVAREAAAERAAVNEAQRAAREAYSARVRRIEQAVGENIVHVERIMRNELIREPNVVMNHDQRLALADRQFSLDEVERWVTDTYGPQILEEAS